MEEWILLVWVLGKDPPQQAAARRFESRAACEWVRLVVFEPTSSSSTRYACRKRPRRARG